MLGVHLGDLPVFRQVDDEVSGLKGGLRGDLKPAVGRRIHRRVWDLKGASGLVEHLHRRVGPLGEHVPVAQVDGQAEQGQGAGQGGHGDEQEAAAEGADHAPTSRV